MKRLLTPPTLAIAIALSLLSCDNRYNTSTLIINEIIDDPAGSKPIVYVALSRTPDFLGGIKTYATTYNIAIPSSPAVVFESISWESKNEGEAGEFWLLIAEDANAPAVINNGDNVLPAMRVILENGKTTTIDTIVFNTIAGPPLRIFEAVNFANPLRKFNIFVEDQSIVTSTTPMYLRLGLAVNLSTAAAATFDIPVTDNNLVSGLQFRTTATNGLVWIDLDSSGDLSADDWMSTDPSILVNTDITTDSFFHLVLWSGMTF